MIRSWELKGWNEFEHVFICYLMYSINIQWLHQDKVLKDMDETDEMKAFSSSEEESEETDEDLENEQRLQKALLEKDKVRFEYVC